MGRQALLFSIFSLRDINLSFVFSYFVYFVSIDMGVSRCGDLQPGVFLVYPTNFIYIDYLLFGVSSGFHFWERGVFVFTYFLLLLTCGIILGGSLWLEFFS